MTELCNDRHWIYLLTCEEYAEIYNRQGGACGICELPEEKTLMKQLHVDHQERMGYWAVRGLLCPRCNTSQVRARPDDEDVQAYLASAWWLTLPEPMKQPPVGTHLRGRWSGVWRRTPEGWLDPKHGLTNWDRVVSQVGPYLRLLRDRQGRTYPAPAMAKPRLPAGQCQSRRRVAPADLTVEAMTRPMLIAEVKRLRRMIQAANGGEPVWQRYPNTAPEDAA